MNRLVAIGAVLLAVGSFGAASWYAGGKQEIKPLAYVPPKMLITAPPACQPVLQKYGLGRGHDKTVPVDEYLNFKHALEDCGGSLTIWTDGGESIMSIAWTAVINKATVYGDQQHVLCDADLAGIGQRHLYHRRRHHSPRRWLVSTTSTTWTVIPACLRDRPRPMSLTSPLASGLAQMPSFSSSDHGGHGPASRSRQQARRLPATPSTPSSLESKMTQLKRRRSRSKRGHKGGRTAGHYTVPVTMSKYNKTHRKG